MPADIKFPIYMDYMATTPVSHRVAHKMQGCLTIEGVFGNPASKHHSYGWQAAERVDLARQEVANAINADASEIIFTSGATESNNLAIKGAARFYHRKGKHIVTCASEHKAVLDVFKQLEREGFEATYIKPQKNGLIDLNDFEAALRDDTVLVSIMHVNNEVGVIQPIAEMAKVARPRGILFHVDAAQSIGKVKVDVGALDVDLLSLSAHKIYGPKGIGALYVRRTPRVHLQPILVGGGHEHGLRSGTVATHQIVGMGEAYRIVGQQFEDDVKRIKALRDKLWVGIQQLSDVHLNGDMEHRVAQNLNVSFGGVEGETLLVALKNVAVSTGSACTSATLEPSHVLKAMGVPNTLAHSAVRFSLGRYTTDTEIDYAIEYIVSTVAKLR